jgi:hypothetical protein
MHFLRLLIIFQYYYLNQLVAGVRYENHALALKGLEVNGGVDMVDNASEAVCEPLDITLATYSALVRLQSSSSTLYYVHSPSAMCGYRMLQQSLGRLQTATDKGTFQRGYKCYIDYIPLYCGVIFS